MIYRQFIGIPYSPYRGDFLACDCFGLVRHFFNSMFGIKITAYIYTLQNKGDLIHRYFEAEGFLKADTLQKYDVIGFHFEKKLSHLGVYLGDDKVLHIYNRHSKSSIVTMNRAMKRRIVDIFRHKQFEHGVN